MEKGDCVLNSLTPEEIQDVLDQVVQDMTDRIAGIRLCKQDKILSDDICTVHTTFEGNYHASLILCVEDTCGTRYVLNYISDCNEGAQLIHQLCQ